MNTNSPYQQHADRIAAKRQEAAGKAEQLTALIQQRDEQAAAQFEHLDTAGLSTNRTK